LNIILVKYTVLWIICFAVVARNGSQKLMHCHGFSSLQCAGLKKVLCSCPGQEDFPNAAQVAFHCHLLAGKQSAK